MVEFNWWILLVNSTVSCMLLDAKCTDTTMIAKGDTDPEFPVPVFFDPESFTYYNHGQSVGVAVVGLLSSMHRSLLNVCIYFCSSHQDSTNCMHLMTVHFVKVSCTIWRINNNNETLSFPRLKSVLNLRFLQKCAPRHCSLQTASSWAYQAAHYCKPSPTLMKQSRMRLAAMCLCSLL